MWWPLWGYNIGEYFQNSALGIAELVAAGVIDPTTVQLAPEVGGWPLRDFQTGMLKAFTDLPVRTTGQLAPRCPAKGVVKRKTEKASKCPPPRCYERMLVCRFRDVYEYQPPIAPWSAARAIVRSLRLPPRLPPRPFIQVAHPFFCWAGAEGVQRARRSVHRRDRLVSAGDGCRVGSAGARRARPDHAGLPHTIRAAGL